MDKVIIRIAIFIFLSASSTAFASPTGVVMGGDVRITGTGNGLVFPDMTVQTTATGKGPKGDPGPANTLTMGTVTTGAPGSGAAASIAGTAPNQTLNLIIPQGPQGSAGSTSIPALNLTACTAFDGTPSKILISVAADGTLSFKCPSSIPKFVFLTSKAYNGNLGGLTGADGICQTHANAAGLKGVFKAWLSDSTHSPATRFTHSPGNYITVDGAIVASDWASLTSGNLNLDIRLDETGHAAAAVAFGGTGTGGTVIFGDCAIWSNTSTNGTANRPTSGTVADTSCNNWSDSTGTFNGNHGVFGFFSGLVTCGAVPCNNESILYCFEQ